MKDEAKSSLKGLSLLAQGTPLIQAGRQCSPMMSISLAVENLMKVGFILILEKQSTAEQPTPEIPFNLKEKRRTTPWFGKVMGHGTVAARPSRKLANPHIK